MIAHILSQGVVNANSSKLAISPLCALRRDPLKEQRLRDEGVGEQNVVNYGEHDSRQDSNQNADELMAFSP